MNHRWPVYVNDIEHGVDSRQGLIWQMHGVPGQPAMHAGESAEGEITPEPAIDEPYVEPLIEAELELKVQECRETAPPEAPNVVPSTVPVA